MVAPPTSASASAPAASDQGPRSSDPVAFSGSSPPCALISLCAENSAMPPSASAMIASAPPRPNSASSDTPRLSFSVGQAPQTS